MSFGSSWTIRRYSFTALSICPFSTNLRAASMTFSLLKATSDYSLLGGAMHHKHTAVCRAHLEKGTARSATWSRKSTKESRALSQSETHIGSLVAGAACHPSQGCTNDQAAEARSANNRATNPVSKSPRM